MTIKHFLIGLLCVLQLAIVNGQVKNQTDAQGRKQGYWEAVDRNGHLVYAGYFKNDKPVGEMKRYHPQGGIRVIMIYDNQSVHVRARFFYTNGKLAATGNYVNTKKDSIWTYYSDYDQKITYRQEYKSGIRIGKSISYYPEGQIAEENQWTNDQKNGAWVQYFENGQVKLKGSFKNDEREGNFYAYYPDGKKETEGNYKNGFPDGKWVHYKENGQIASSIEYKDGQIANLEEVEKAEQEFFKKIEQQEGKIVEPTLEDLVRQK